MHPDWIKKLDDISQGFQWSQVLFSALRAGLFEELESWREPRDVAAAVAWNPNATRRLLNALVAIGLVDREGGKYRNAPIASACLLPEAPETQNHILLHKGGSWPSWSRLDESLRSGTALDNGARERSPEQLRHFILGMADIAKESAQKLLQLVDLTDRKHLLDIGAGPGSYSFAFLDAAPKARATLFDLPEVLPITEEQARLAGHAGRVTLQPGDLTRDVLGGGYDCVLLSNIIHSYSAPQNEDLVRRCYDALTTGGLLLIKDFLVDDDAPGPAFSRLFALHMLLHAPGGDVYSTADAAAWTDKAGFRPGRCLDLTEQSRVWVVSK